MGATASAAGGPGNNAISSRDISRSESGVYGCLDDICNFVLATNHFIRRKLSTQWIIVVHHIGQLLRQLMNWRLTTFSHRKTLTSLNSITAISSESSCKAPSFQYSTSSLMDRMAASNRSIRMKHGTTTLDIMVPLIRDTNTVLGNGTTQRNLTTPLNSGTFQRDTTTQFRIPAQNALRASSYYVPGQWMSPSSPSSLIVTTSYRIQVPIPPPSSRFSVPPYNFPPPYIPPSNSSTTSKLSKRSQYPIPPYVPPYSCPPYTTQSSMPVYTSLSSSLTSTSQSFTTSTTYLNSTSSIRSSTSAYSPGYPTPTHSTAYSVPTYTPRSSTSTYNLSPSFRMNPRSAHYSASPSYSHYTFPRSAHYTMPFLDTHCTVMPQSSTQNSYPSSMYKSSINVWPTKIGSVMQASMENICSVLATQLQNLSQPSTRARTDFAAQQVKNQSLNPKTFNSIKTASNSCPRNYSEQSVKKSMSLYKNDNEKIETNCSSMQLELQNAWLYLNKLEIVDIKPNGEIKCICPAIKFEDVLKLSINNKHMLVNLHQHYKINSKYIIQYTIAYSRNTLITICTYIIMQIPIFGTFCNFVISRISYLYLNV